MTGILKPSAQLTFAHAGTVLQPVPLQSDTKVSGTYDMYWNTWPICNVGADGIRTPFMSRAWIENNVFGASVKFATNCNVGLRIPTTKVNILKQNEKNN